MRVNGVTVYPYPTRSVGVRSLHDQFSVRFHCRVYIHVCAISIGVSHGFGHQVHFRGQPCYAFYVLVYPTTIGLPVGGVVRSTIVGYLGPVHVWWLHRVFPGPGSTYE